MSYRESVDRLTAPPAAEPDGAPMPPGTPSRPAGGYRWVICALLFFATTINYVDRQILSLLKPILDEKLGWTNEQFGAVNAAFQAAYAVALLGFGLDWLLPGALGSREAMVAVTLYVVFPIFLLCVLETDSPFLPFSMVVFAAIPKGGKAR